ncbi:hypothetical protein, partial [Actinomadura sp. KC345]|uniref:hypothetical protein n=1 Tax=Actinomadura sp. KC345 TaxID=2530371 RepID=UPI0014054C92
EAPPPRNGPAYGQGAGYGRGPAFGEGPPYREGPAHGQVPAPRDGPAYGAAPGYGRAPAYGDAPGHGDRAGYDGYDDGGGYQDAAPYGDEGGHPGEAGHGPADQGDYDEAPGKAERRGKKGKQRGKGGQGRPGRPPGRKRPAAGKRGQGAKLYFGAAAGLLVLVLVLAGLGAVVGLRGESGAKTEDAAGPRIGTPAETGLSPKSYSSSASASAYSGIASRRADPGPLTIGEVFPSSAAKLSVPDGEVRVTLRAKRLDGDCAAAVWGATVGQVLGEGGCTQAARGIYSGGEDGYALAVAVFNLAGSKEAGRFVATLEDTIGSGFVRPLEAPAPLDGFGRGFGMARGLAMGHFAVVTWAQRMDGKGGPEDESMLSLLIEGGQNPAVLGRAARTSE